MKWPGRGSRAADKGGAEPLLRVRELSVRYGRRVLAVQGVSLEVAKGEIVALLGPNGAGKTSTLRGISGFLSAEPGRVAGGTVLLDGRSIAGLAPHQTMHLGVFLVPERDKVFTHLTVEQNLFLGVDAGARARSEEVFAYFPPLRRLLNRTAGYISGGERQMLALARGVVSGARLLLVDEMSLGLSPAALQQLLTTVQTLNRERGLTVLLVEQNAAAALSIAARCYVLETGRIVAAGSATEMRDHVAGLYLGEGERPRAGGAAGPGGQPAAGSGALGDKRSGQEQEEAGTHA